MARCDDPKDLSLFAMHVAMKCVYILFAMCVHASLLCVYMLAMDEHKQYIIAKLSFHGIRCAGKRTELLSLVEHRQQEQGQRRGKEEKWRILVKEQKDR